MRDHEIVYDNKKFAVYALVNVAGEWARVTDWWTDRDQALEQYNHWRDSNAV